MESLPSLSIAGTTCHCGLRPRGRVGAKRGTIALFSVERLSGRSANGCAHDRVHYWHRRGVGGWGNCQAGDIGGRAVGDAYDALRALIVRKLGKGGAVQNIEDEPRSEPAQASLAEALSQGWPRSRPRTCGTC